MRLFLFSRAKKVKVLNRVVYSFRLEYSRRTLNAAGIRKKRTCRKCSEEKKRHDAKMTDGVKA